MDLYSFGNGMTALSLFHTRTKKRERVCIRTASTLSIYITFNTINKLAHTHTRAFAAILSIKSILFMWERANSHTLTHERTDRPTDRSTKQPTGQPSKHPTNQTDRQLHSLKEYKLSELRLKFDCVCA